MGLFTYADIYDHLIEFAAEQTRVSPTVIRQAIQEAYEEIASAHCWRFLERPGRIPLKAAKTTGTVVYDHTGGTYERELTLTGSTWPMWAQDASIRFGSVVSDIQTRESDTVCTLNSIMNPGEDVASTTYQIFRRWYHLPEDFLNFTGPWASQTWRFGQPISLTQLENYYRYETDTGEILYHCLAEVPDVYGRKALWVWPPSASDEPLDYVYTRRPRELRYSGHDSADWAGTITVSAASAEVVGVGTSWTDEMVGSILRVGRDTNRPTGRAGDYPYAEERSVKSITDTTHLTLDAAIATSRAGVAYMIVDPIDLGMSAHNAFRRLCEYKLAVKRHLKIADDECWTRYQRALLEAMGADNPLRDDQASEHPYPVFLNGTVSFAE